MRANQRLDAQARDLAEFRRQMTSSRTRTASMNPRKYTGVRISARLRGAAVEDDEWQEVPDEWLAASDTHKGCAKDAPPSPLPSSKKGMKTGLESDDSSISELTELSDGEDDAEGETEEEEAKETSLLDTEVANPASAGEDTDVEAEDQQDQVANPVDPSTTTPPPPDDFVEWETVGITRCVDQSFTDLLKQICVTLKEWESFGEQFEKASHYAEKALYKVLTQHIVPMVTAELRVRATCYQTRCALFYSLQGRREETTDRRSCRAAQAFV